MPNIMHYEIEGESKGAKVRIEVDMVDIEAGGDLLLQAVKRALEDLAKKWDEAQKAKGNGGADESADEVIPDVGTVKKGALVRC